MFDWDDLRLFLAVARDGGLAAATMATGKSPPTLGRRMVALERRLGHDLFHRTARGYDLTEQGMDLLRVAESLEQRILPVLAEGQHTLPLVKVSAGTWVTSILCEHVPDMVGAGRIRLRFIAADEKVDIGRREALIGVRNQRPAGIGLAGRAVGPVRFAVYASGDDLPWARVLANTPSALWVRNHTTPNECIEVTSPRNALDLALVGQARAVLPTFIGDSFETLTRKSPLIAELEHDQWLVTHHEDRYLPEVRQVIDRIYAILKSQTRTAR